MERFTGRKHTLPIDTGQSRVKRLILITRLRGVACDTASLSRVSQSSPGRQPVMFVIHGQVEGVLAYAGNRQAAGESRGLLGVRVGILRRSALALIVGASTFSAAVSTRLADPWRCGRGEFPDTDAVNPPHSCRR